MDKLYICEPFLKSFMETIISVRAVGLAAMERAVECLWIGSKQDSLAELLAEGTWAIKLCCSLNVQE